MKILIIAALIFSASFTSGIAQQDSPQRDNTSGLPSASAVPKELYAKSSNFFKALILSNIEDGYTNLLQQSPIRDNKEQFKRLIDQTKRSFELYGNAKGYERVDEEYATESLMRLRYITIHDNLPMRWVFTYYKSPKHGWMIINIKFDDEAEVLFKNG